MGPEMFPKPLGHGFLFEILNLSGMSANGVKAGTDRNLDHVSS
jgi:hypothetical protein